MMRVYKLGEGYPVTAEGKTLYSYPFTVHYTPEGEYGLFYFASGGGRNGNGTFLSVIDILKPNWLNELHSSHAEWLLPFVERLAQGESVNEAEILEAYQQVHGKPPETSEWRR